MPEEFVILKVYSLQEDCCLCQITMSKSNSIANYLEISMASEHHTATEEFNMAAQVVIGGHPSFLTLSGEEVGQA